MYSVLVGAVVLVGGGYLLWQHAQPSALALPDAVPLRVGALLPLSGKNEYYGKEIQNAIELARAEINEQGGIGGRRLEVVYEDDKTDPRLGVSGMNKLATADRVPVVLGSWASGVVLATAPIAEEHKVVVMAEAIAPKISEAGDYIFRIQPSAVLYVHALLEGLPKLAVRRLAVLYINNEFGRALYDTILTDAQKQNIEIVASESYAEGDQDFRTQLLKIKGQKPDALFVGGYQEQASAMRQAHELGFTGKILASATFENQTLVAELGALAEGVIYPYHFSSDTTNPKAQDYLRQYQNRFGVASGGFGAAMYDGVFIVAEALRKCGENTACIKDALYNTRHEGVNGTTTFDSNGDPLMPIILKTVKDRKFVHLAD